MHDEYNSTGFKTKIQNWHSCSIYILSEAKSVQNSCNLIIIREMIDIVLNS